MVAARRHLARDRSSSEGLEGVYSVACYKSLAIVRCRCGVLLGGRGIRGQGGPQRRCSFRDGLGYKGQRRNMSLQLKAGDIGLSDVRYFSIKLEPAALTPVVPGALLTVVDGTCVVVTFALPSATGNACAPYEDIRVSDRARRATTPLENAMMKERQTGETKGSDHL